MEKKRLILMECFTNVSHQKILLKEQEELEIGYVFLVVMTKNEINKRIKSKNLNLKRKLKKR